MKFYTATLLIGFAFAHGKGICEASDRPNIIMVLIDGLNRDSLSCYGADQATPNIDQLARDGMRYETVWSMPAYTSNQVTVLTGQYPFRHGWNEQHEGTQHSKRGPNWERFTTFPKQLSSGGYQTAIGGHWQFNHFSKQPDALQQHGFDESCVWDQSRAAPDKSLIKRLSDNLIINGKRKQVDDGAGRINSFLTDFVKRHRKQKFFIYYSMMLERVPLDHAQEKSERPPSIKANPRSARIKHIDQLIGDLISTVDANGLREKTAIVIAGTNAAPSDKGFGKESKVPTMTRLSDHVVHVPLIVRAVGMTGTQTVSYDLIDYSDFYPTFLELAGLTAAKNPVLDGRSFVPSLRGSEDPYEKRNWIYSQLGDTRMIRDWQHLIDNHGNFHDLQKDPLQQHEVSPLDKIAPGRRQRLQMILDRFPDNAIRP